MAWNISLLASLSAARPLGVSVTPLGDDIVRQAQTVIEAAIDECDRFYPAFQFILWGDKTPAEALASAMVDAQGEA